LEWPAERMVILPLLVDFVGSRFSVGCLAGNIVMDRDLARGFLEAGV